MVLSQPTRIDDRVKHISARHQFDRIGDHFAAHQRGAHPFGAHGDAVGNGYGVELQRRSAGCADAGLHVDGKLSQVIVARANFDPGVRYADERLGEILVLESAGAQHGASTGTIRTVNQVRGFEASAKGLSLRCFLQMRLHQLVPASSSDFRRSTQPSSDREPQAKKTRAIILLLDDGPESLCY